MHIKILKKAWFLLSILLLVSLFVFWSRQKNTSAQFVIIPAFPEAEGHGALALSACDKSDIKIIEVTNLNDSGTGSFRDAITNQTRDGKLDIIIFRTGGTIITTGNIRFTRSCVYIAGQTAPGDGIMMRWPDPPPSTVRAILGTSDSGTNPQDIVVRYLKLRQSPCGDPCSPIDADVISLRNARNHIYDHVSMAWGTDEGFSLNSGSTLGLNGPQNITLQRSIVAEALIGHSTGTLITGVNPISKISLHHNIYAHNAHRNPLLSPDGNIDLEFINNVVYNWKSRAAGFGDNDVNPTILVDFIGNYYKAGPWSNSSNYIWSEDCGGISPEPQPYSSDMIGLPNFPAPGSNFGMYKFHTTCPNGGQTIPTSWFRSSPLTPASKPVTIQPVMTAYNDVLADSGANRRLACNGDWVWTQDRIDSDIVSHIINGTGPRTDSENDQASDHGGWPTVSPGISCLDTDRDGMPDEFEDRYSLNKNLATDNRLDPDSDGYSNILEYLNGTNPNIAGTGTPTPTPTSTPTPSPGVIMCN